MEELFAQLNIAELSAFVVVPVKRQQTTCSQGGYF